MKEDIMRRTRLIGAFLLTAVAGFIISGFAKSLPVNGVVKAEATNQPIDSAMIVLFEGSLSMSTMPTTFDTIFTNKDGTFQKTITITDTAKGLISAVYKTGYLAKTAFKPFITGIPNSVDLGTILLKTIADAKDTLQVKGLVVDSITKQPLQNALIVITSGLIGDITIDSIVTGADGRFNEKIPYIKNSPLFNEMIYFASKTDYQPKGGRKAIPANEIVDLGTIELYNPNIAIKNTVIKLIQGEPTHVAVYTLNGKMIYKGTTALFQKALNGLSSSQQLIIRYYRNDMLVGELKGVSIK